MKTQLLILLLLLSSVSARRINFELEMKKLATEITQNVPADSQHTVVILPFNDTRAPGFAAIVEEYLTIPLVQQGKVQVVDRSQLATIIAEADLMRMMDQPGKIGKLASAQYMLTGSVSVGFDKNYLITLRLISVETSRVIGAVSAEIPQAELEKRVRRN